MLDPRQRLGCIPRGHGHLDHRRLRDCKLGHGPHPHPHPPHLTAECWALPGLTVVLGFPQVVDKWFKSNDEEAFAFARMLIAQEGLLCGEWMPRSALPASVQRVRDTLTLAARPPAPGALSSVGGFGGAVLSRWETEQGVDGQ